MAHIPVHIQIVLNRVNYHVAHILAHIRTLVNAGFRRKCGNLELISLRDSRRGTSRLRTEGFRRFHVKWMPRVDRGGYPESNG